MQDLIRTSLRECQEKTDNLYAVAALLVRKKAIEPPKLLSSVEPKDLVEIFYEETQSPRDMVEGYIEAVKADYKHFKAKYQQAGITDEVFQKYFGTLQSIAFEYQKKANERQQIEHQRLYYQFNESVEAAIERNIPPAKRVEDFVPNIIEEINKIEEMKEIKILIQQKSIFRKFIKAKTEEDIAQKGVKTEKEKIMQAASQEILDQISDDAFKKALQDSLKLDDDTAGLVSRYLRKKLEEVLRYPSRYRIHGLFTEKEGEETQGFVRDVYVEIWPKGTGKLSYGFKLADNKQGEDFKDSATFGRDAAIKLINELYSGSDNPSQYDIELNIEGAGADYKISYSGGSIGLATALGIIARCTEQVIGVEQVGDVAVTGKIADEDGRIESVGGIEWKTKAIIDLNKQGIKPVPINYLFVPADNKAEASAANEKYHGKLDIRAFNDLESLIKEEIGILFDPFKQYLETISKVEEPTVTISDEVWNQINTGDTKRFAILGEFDKDKRSIAEALATRFAEERLRSKASPKETTHDALIPVTLDAKLFSRDDLLFDLVYSAVSERLKTSNSEPFDEALIRRALRTGRFALIISGLDITEDMPFFASGGAMSDYKKFYSDTRIIFVCTESSLNMYKNQIADSEQCSVIPLYEGRSTFLDKHIDDVINPTNGIAKSEILACHGNADLTPKEFFYPVHQEKPSYIELLVRRLLVRRLNKEEDMENIEKPRPLSEVISEGRDRHILLLADGGAGKTTLLLKLFFDCLEGKCKLSNPEIQGNDSWRQLIVPFFANLGKLSSNYKTLYDLFPDLPNSELETELGATENILIMLDGLDRITQGVRERDEDLANDIHQFLNDLDGKNPNHWVILSCRKQEEIRERRSLIRLIEQDEMKKYFVKYEILDLSLEASENYLHRAVPQNAEQLINTLGESQKDILKNPMLLYLFSTLDPAEVKEMEKEQGRPLNRSLIYQMAMDEWISKQFDARGVFRIFSRKKAYYEAPRKLLGILAKEMVDRGMTSISEAKAVEIFDELFEEQKPTWWPREAGETIAAQDILDELVAGGLLKLSG